jgi:FtsZ-binding cell division protein ZapB
MVSIGTQTHRYMPKRFDIHSEEDDKTLREWCQLHWQYIICKGINGNNAPTYHDCCISFSRKGCVKKSSHPGIQSASVLKIPSLKCSAGPDDLYRWLKIRLRTHHKLELKTFFPSINTAHFTTEVDYNEDSEEQLEVLGKRCNKAVEELAKARDEIDRLKQDNKALHSSTKSWYSKYQDLLSKEQDDAPSYTETTPVKQTKQSELDDFIKL